MTDERKRPEPLSPSGEAWRKAEEFTKRLEETGDTPTSFFVKGASAVPQ